MKNTALGGRLQLVLVVLIFSLAVTACSLKERFEERERDEIVGGVAIPIPRGMSKVSDGRVEVTLPGFGGEKAAFRGNESADDILSFYKREMPERGWKPNASLAARGGMLAYTKDNRSLLVMVSSPDRGDTTLNIVVGSLGSK